MSTKAVMLHRSKIVLATLGTSGDVHPFIGIARHLRDRGHDPVLATPAVYRPKIEAEGLGFHAMRPDEPDQFRDLGINGAGVSRELMRGGKHGLEFVMRRLILPYLRQSLDDLLAASEGASLVIMSSFAYAARLAADIRRIPALHVALQPVMLMSAYDPPAPLHMGWLRSLSPGLARALAAGALRSMDRQIAAWAEPIHRLRRDSGLAPVKHNPLLRGQCPPYGTIGLFSPVLGGVHPDSPANTSIVGFVPYDSEVGGAARLGSELERFLAAGDPPLVFTLGSQAVLSPGEFFAQSLEAARLLGRRAVLLVGRNNPGQTSSPSPDVLVQPYAPYSLLFSTAAAIVHHGGIGTIGHALKSGRPQLVVPFWGDQHDNAARVTRLGVARMLSRSRYTAERVARELSALLSDRYVQKASQTGSKVAEENGAAAVCDIIASQLQRQAA